jgi:hypothetical protein
MGRLTEIFDFVNINPLPPEYEREVIYTHISENDILFLIRKLVYLERRKYLNEQKST